MTSYTHLAMNLARLRRDPVLLLAFGFGSGLAKRAPGTVGTLAAVPLYWLLQNLSLMGYMLVLAAAIVAGIGICGHAARTLGVHDHPGIVWDEFCGFWLTMIAAPPGWYWLAAGFALFRLFDIVKPWPINRADRSIHGGLGIMLDDLMAGLYALMVLQLAALLFS